MNKEIVKEIIEAYLKRERKIYEEIEELDYKEIPKKKSKKKD